MRCFSLLSQKRFQELYRQLKPEAKARGTGLQRGLHMMLTALCLRIQGTAYACANTIGAAPVKVVPVLVQHLGLVRLGALIK